MLAIDVPLDADIGAMRGGGGRGALHLDMALRHGWGCGKQRSGGDRGQRET